MVELREPELLKKIIGKKLVQLREDRNLIQNEVAVAINVVRSTYVKYENGDIQPPTNMLLELANFFNVAADYLLDRTDIANPYEGMPSKQEIISRLAPEEILQYLGIKDKKLVRVIARSIEEAKELEMANQ
jgi:transcriptional regulator with XRE-family HTH domain